MAKPPCPTRRALLGAAFALPALRHAAAQPAAWPDRPVRLIVPFAAGGAIDTLSRSLAARFPEHANGQPLVVENRPGAGGVVAGTFTAQQRPDGYTVMMADMGPNAVAKEIFRSVPYDPATAFTPVAHLVNLAMALIVRADLPARNLAELLADARARPGALNYASAGNGNSSHLIMELLMREAGVRMTHVPYRGGGEITASLLKGETDLSFPSASTGLPFVRDGRMRALAVGEAEEVPALPGVPPVARTIPGFGVTIWHGILAPAGLPPELATRMAEVFNATIRTPELAQQVQRNQAARIVAGGPQDFATLIAAEIARWTPLIRAAGIRAD
jgi:tripartite-type tricarboxylate transporter receptor subunit TctC